MKVIDCVTYNGEQELFEIRYNILKDYVDEFIVVEFDKTFSGRKKKQKWKWAYPKLNYFWIEESQYSKYKDLALSSPNTQGAEHWKLEFMQKESIKDCLTHLKDQDIVFIGDCDEIWNPKHLDYLISGKEPEKLKLQVFTYYLNNLSSEEFWGTIVTPYQWIKDACLNHLRTNAKKTNAKYGWHFTSLAPYLKEKLLDSYTEESYATPQVIAQLEKNIQQNKDFLGRDFSYQLEEEDWPPWLKEHSKDYQHVLK